MNRIIKQNIEVLYPDLSYKINGICFNVHNQLGRFGREKQYADELEIELRVVRVFFAHQSR